MDLARQPFSWSPSSFWRDVVTVQVLRTMVVTPQPSLQSDSSVRVRQLISDVHDLSGSGKRAATFNDLQSLSLLSPKEVAGDNVGTVSVLDLCAKGVFKWNRS